MGIRSPADGVPSERGPGLSHRRHADAARGERKPDARGDPSGRGCLPRREGREPRVRHLGVQFLGRRAECGARLRTAQGLERARTRGFGGGNRQSRQRQAHADPRRTHIRTVATAHPGPRHHERLLLPPAGSRRRRPGTARCSARSAPRRSSQEPRTSRRARRRPPGFGAGHAHHRPREGQYIRRHIRRHQLDDHRQSRLYVRQRLSQCGPHAARHRPGRGKSAHADGRPPQAQRAQCGRRHGAALRLLPDRVGKRALAGRRLQWLSFGAHQRPSRAGALLRRRDRGDGTPRSGSTGWLRLRVDGSVPAGNPVRIASALSDRPQHPLCLPAAGGTL